MLAGIMVDNCNVGWGEALDIAFNTGEIGGYPYPILQAIKTDSEQPHDLISASQLTGCLRQSYLKTVVPYYESPGRRIPLMMGTFTHWLMEKASEPDVYTEVPLRWTTPSGVVITGHADRVDVKRAVLSDWKTAKAVIRSRLPYGSHEAQVNVYAYLLRHNEIGIQANVGNLEIIYIDLTGPAKNGDHDGVVVFRVPFWTDRKAFDFITTRAEILHNAANEMPPMIEKKDRWMCNYCPLQIRETCEKEPIA